MIVRHLGFEAYDLLPTVLKRAIQHSVNGDVNPRAVYFTWIDHGVDKALKLIEDQDRRYRYSEGPTWVIPQHDQFTISLR